MFFFDKYLTTIKPYLKEPLVPRFENIYHSKAAVVSSFDPNGGTQTGSQKVVAHANPTLIRVVQIYARRFLVRIPSTAALWRIMIDAKLASQATKQVQNLRAI